MEFALTGKVGTQSEILTDGSIANLVVTVEKAAALISFTIDGTSCQAEEGMTWNEWCNSSYNTLGVYVCTANYVHTNDTHSLSSENGNKIILEAKNYSSVKEKCDCGA